MTSDANPPPRAEDQDRLYEISISLADAVEAVLGAWIERLVLERVEQWQGSVGPETAAAATEAGHAAVDDVMPRLRALLTMDIDQQRTNPLSLLRGATRHAHDVLARVGMPPVVRDEFTERSFPDDVYGLVPATWTDVHPSLHEVGISWGAAKAYVHKARRRSEGPS